MHADPNPENLGQTSPNKAWPATPAGRKRQRQLAVAAKRSLPRDRAASYSRYSATKQSELSNADQQRKQSELADRNGHSILPKLEFADAAVSGTKLSRDDLDRMLLAAEAGEFNVLYLYSLSRLARESILTMPMMKKLVHSYGIRVITVLEGIDTERDGWELITSIIAVMHEQFLKDLAASVLRGQEGIVLAGLCVGDYRFGFKSIPLVGSASTQRRDAARPKKMYVIDEEAAP